MGEQEEIYRKFRESKREDVRLEAALAGFLNRDGEGAQNLEDAGEQRLEDAGMQNSEGVRRQNSKNVRRQCPDCTGTQREEYAAYLRRRIRPAMELLIQREDTEKMEILAAQGWFGRRELDGFLRTAEAQKKQDSLLWLLHWKDKNYGYEDDEFEL